MQGILKCERVATKKGYNLSYMGCMTSVTVNVYKSKKQDYKTYLQNN